MPTGSSKASHSPCVSFPSLLHSALLLQVSVKAWGNWATCSRRDRSVSHARAKNPRASVSTEKRLQRNTLHRLQSNYPSTYQSIITGQHPVVMLFFFFKSYCVSAFLLTTWHFHMTHVSPALAVSPHPSVVIKHPLGAWRYNASNVSTVNYSY